MSTLLDNFLKTLPDQATRELMGGDEKDIAGITNKADALLSSLLEVVPVAGATQNLDVALPALNAALDEWCKLNSLVYFVMTELVPYDLLSPKPYIIEWLRLFEQNKKLCLIAPRGYGKTHDLRAAASWALYRYRSPSKPEWAHCKDLHFCFEAYLFSDLPRQAERTLEGMKELIGGSPSLSDALIPKSKDLWGKTRVTAKTGARLITQGRRGGVRGPHPGIIMYDDLLSDADKISETQRRDTLTFFNSKAKYMLRPGGTEWFVGTPFSEDDLIAQLKKRKSWKYVRYPAIYPDGTLLDPEIHTLEQLLEMRADDPIAFSQEMLGITAENEASIFPQKILEKATAGMEAFYMPENIEDFPIPLKMVVLGCDFALSSSVGANYSVYITLGLDDAKNYWLLDMERGKGWTFVEQQDIIRKLNIRYKYDRIGMETNQMQAIFAQEAKTRIPGLPALEIVTGADKHDTRTGIPSIATLFEMGKIKIPIGGERERRTCAVIFGELKSFIWQSGKLEVIRGHVDSPYAFWKAIQASFHVPKPISVSHI